MRKSHRSHHFIKMRGRNVALQGKIGDGLWGTGLWGGPRSAGGPAFAGAGHCAIEEALPASVSDTLRSQTPDELLRWLLRISMSDTLRSQTPDELLRWPLHISMSD